MMTPVLLIHRADRADGLVRALADLLAGAGPAADPMVPEVVAVPTPGIERWLSQRLSTRLGISPGRGDGVCANVLFPFPGRVVGRALAAATGVDGESDPWAAERAAWALLDVVDANLGEPWLAPLAAHLRAGAGARSRSGGTGEVEPNLRARRFSTVRHLAGLFDRYGVHRPEMLSAWAAGGDGEGTGGALPARFGWQAELWRRLRARIGVPSPAERLDAACEALRDQAGDDPGLAEFLPERFCLFGLTRLPASHLRVLDALAARRDVHLFLLHPSPALWSRLAEVQPDPAAPAVPVRRRDDPTIDLPRNPFLASWGRDTRELQIVLGSVATAINAADDAAAPDAAAESPTTLPALATPAPGTATPGRAPTLLERLQSDVRSDRCPPGEPLPGGEEQRAVLDPADGSLTVHACHGRARQVEVLRDAIAHLLVADPGLEPRDVVVMCPDIEAFAPLIHATFGTAEAAGDPDPLDHSMGDAAGDGAGDTATGRLPDLRVRLADRSLRQTNPVLGVLATLVDLASARLTAAQVLDLAGREPVRRRFALDDDDLGRVEEWVADTGIRWGLDAEGRAPFGLDALEANTWRAGLDRILVGVAMADEGQRLMGDVLPLDDVGSGDIDLAGRFAEFVERLGVSLEALRHPQPIAGWAAALAGSVAALTATSPADAWQGAQAHRLLEEAMTEAGEPGQAPSSAELSLVELRALLADRLRGRPTRANFRTGHLTVCTLVPMRSVPHRVVCLLGLDDGSFPRRTVVDGDDLVAADPRVGDRDVRSEERQLLLDALMAAGEHLIVTYSGRDERTNAERPPAVPVGELLDVADRTATLATGGRVRDQIVVHHPLQPFDPRNFTAGALVPGRVWSFDAVALAGAAAMCGPRRAPAPFLETPLPELSGDPAAGRADTVEVDDLVRFAGHPVKAFLRQRLGVSLTDVAEDASAALPVELDPLERWQVGQRLLEGRLAGASMDSCVHAERARGTLPPGALADGVLNRIVPVVEGLAREAAALRSGPDGSPLGPPGSVDVYVLFDEAGRGAGPAAGRSLVGTVSGVVGDRLLSVTYSAVGPKHRLAAWIRFLALSAAHPERRFEAATVGRARFGGPRGARRTTVHLRALGSDARTRRQVALGHLAVLVDLYDRGRREPLPLFTKTSAAWAAAVAAGRSPRFTASASWESTFEREGEDAEPEHQLVLGGILPFADILGFPPGKDEEGPGWAGDETTRFGRYARRLWDALLTCEEVVDS